MLMKILTYNILFSGKDGRLPHLAEVIQSTDADIVMLDEANNPDAVAELAQRAGYPFYGCQRHSTAYLSRVSVIADWLKPPMGRSAFLRLILRDHRLHLYGVHLLPSLLFFAEWLRQKELNALKNYLPADIPHAILGDFNTIAPGDPMIQEEFPLEMKIIMQMNGGDARRTAIASLLKSGYTDAFRHLYPDEPGYTMPTQLLASIPNTRLDYAFLSKELIPQLVDCQPLRHPPAIHKASDHFPVLLEIDL